MKSLRVVIGIVFVVLVCSGTCFPAGSSLTYSSHEILFGGYMRIVTLAWVGDDTTGAVSGSSDSITIPGDNLTMTEFIKGCYLSDVEVDPGSVAPTANYDIDITSSRGADLSGGGLDDLSATVTQRRRLAGYSGASNTWMGEQTMIGPITITWAETTAVSSTGTITMVFRRPVK